jgi:hypothetical protein
MRIKDIVKGFLFGFLLFLAGCTAMAVLQDAMRQPVNDEGNKVDKSKLTYPSWVIDKPDYIIENDEDCTCGSKSDKHKTI